MLHVRPLAGALLRLYFTVSRGEVAMPNKKKDEPGMRFGRPSMTFDQAMDVLLDPANKSKVAKLKAAAKEKKKGKR